MVRVSSILVYGIDNSHKLQGVTGVSDAHLPFFLNGGKEFSDFRLP
jgi:hypothetical protein